MAPTNVPGLLFVYAEPGSRVTDTEFDAWVDEHVPRRMTIPGFQYTTVWTAADGKTPSRLGAYDVTTSAVFADEAYTSLARTLSDHEKDVMSRLAASDRRIYDALPSPIDAEPLPPAPAHDVHAPGPFLLILEIQVPAELEEDFNKWYTEEHIPLLSKVPGWRRSRRFILREAGPAKVASTATEKAPSLPPRFLTLHEWESPAGFESEAMVKARNTPWATWIKESADTWEVRLFKAGKSWAGTGQSSS